VRKDFSIAASRLLLHDSPSDLRTIHQPLAPSSILLKLRSFWYDKEKSSAPIRIIAGTINSDMPNQPDQKEKLEALLDVMKDDGRP